MWDRADKIARGINLFDTHVTTSERLLREGLCDLSHEQADEMLEYATQVGILIA